MSQQANVKPGTPLTVNTYKLVWNGEWYADALTDAHPTENEFEVVLYTDYAALLERCEAAEKALATAHQVFGAESDKLGAQLTAALERQRVPEAQLAEAQGEVIIQAGHATEWEAQWSEENDAWQALAIHHEELEEAVKGLLGQLTNSMADTRCYIHTGVFNEKAVVETILAKDNANIEADRKSKVAALSAKVQALEALLTRWLSATWGSHRKHPLYEDTSKALAHLDTLPPKETK